MINKLCTKLIETHRLKSSFSDLLTKFGFKMKMFYFHKQNRSATSFELDLDAKASAHMACF